MVQVSTQLLSIEEDSQDLIEDTLQITVQGPQQVNLAIVDIPGLVSGELNPWIFSMRKTE